MIEGKKVYIVRIDNFATSWDEIGLIKSDPYLVFFDKNKAVMKAKELAEYSYLKFGMVISLHDGFLMGDENG